MNFRIEAFWDDEAEVWVASNDELGLVTEAGSLDHLESKLGEMVPELIELNGLTRDLVPFDLLVHNRQFGIARA
jgi:hypothetical protein